MSDSDTPNDSQSQAPLKMVINRTSMEVQINGNNSDAEFSQNSSDFKKPVSTGVENKSGSDSKSNHQNGGTESKSKDRHHHSLSKDSSSSSSSSKDRDRQHGSASHHKSSSSESKHKDGSSSSSKHHSSLSSSSSSKHREGSTTGESSSKQRDGSSSSSSSKPRDESSKHRDPSSNSSKHNSNSASTPKDGSSSVLKENDSRSKDPSSSSRPKESSTLKEGSLKENDSRSKEPSSNSRPKEGSSSHGHSSSTPSSSKPRLVESSFLVDNITASQRSSGSEKRPSSSSSKHASTEKDRGLSDKKSSGEEQRRSEDVKKEKTIIKTEVASPVKVATATRPTDAKAEGSRPKSKNPISDDDEDDIPLTSRIKPEKAAAPASSDDDFPLTSGIKQEKAAALGSSDDETPLFSRAVKQMKSESEDHLKAKSKRKHDASDEDDVPLAVRAGAKKSKTEEDGKRRHSTGAMKRGRSPDDDDDYVTPKRSKDTKSKSHQKTKQEHDKSPQKGGKTKKDKDDAPDTTWKWWEDEHRDDSIKWKTLEHKGPIFAPPYERLPKDVKFYYDGRPMRLSTEAEEVAGFYGKMLEHEYTTKELFNKNFFKDWKKVMTQEERDTIIDLRKCNFKEICEYYKGKSEERKNMTKEQKQELKKENEALVKEYGFCIIDGHKQKVGNFRIEPPGLFRGRGDHPKQGALKKRTLPSDIIINCGKGSKIPVPPSGTKWKEVRHDNTVTWLASWNENVQGATKYIMLNAASKLKGEKDWKKYETARKLHRHVDKIRANYREDLKSKEMKIRQRAVAMYFIDKLALRAGNEKDEDTADTVGCCSLRFEHVKLHDQLDGKECVVEFDFLGKDSIRYYNAVPVDKRVFKNLGLFMDNKHEGDDLFDRLNTTILNEHLKSLMDGLSAKVFRTYNASRTLQEQLDLLTVADDPINAKLLSYNRANRAVAILCNHQRAAPKNFDKQMENLQGKIDDKKKAVKEAKKAVKDAKSDYKANKSVAAKAAIDKKQKALERAEEQLAKLELQATDKDENKEIALGTSKLNYLDPRISVAWCKKWNVPIEKIFNKTQREKFAWALDMADEDYSFY